MVSTIPRQVSPTQRAEIVQHLLLGNTREATAKTVGVSSGTVSNTWRLFKNNVQTLGLDQAQTVFNVEQIIENYRELGGDLRKAGLTVEQALDGIRHLKLLEKVGMDPNEVERFLNDVVKHALAAQWDTATLVPSMRTFFNLEKQTGRTYPQLLTHYEAMRRDIDDLTNQKKRLQDKVKMEEGRRDTALSNADLTIRTIQEYQSVRAALTQNGIEIKETKLLVKLITNAKEFNYDPARLVAQLKSIDGILETRTQLESEIKKLEVDKVQIEQDIIDANQELTKLRKQQARVQTETDEIVNAVHERLRTVGADAAAALKKRLNQQIDFATASEQKLRGLLTTAETTSASTIQKIDVMLDTVNTALKELLESAAKTGKALARFPAITTIITLIERAEGQPAEVYSALLLVCQQFKLWQTAKQPQNIMMQTAINLFLSNLQQGMQG